MSKPQQQVLCTDIDGKTYQVASDQLSFRPAVYGVIVQEGKILMSKQWDGYDFPGGGIELGESTEDALVREVKEETGLDVKIGNIIDCQHSFFKLPFRGTFVHSIHLYYECSVVGGELSTEFFDANEKLYADKAEWLELTKVKSLKIYSSADVSKVLENFL